MRNILVAIGIFCLSINVVHAADVSIMAPKIISNEGQFNVLLNLSTDGTPINSIDITISYPKDLLTFRGYQEDGSIKKIWLISPKDTNGEIHFSGIIPGGVDGVYDPDKQGLQPIPLVQLIFTPKQNGIGEFKLIHSDILQNDGAGTPLTHVVKDSPITISLSQTSTPDSGESSSDNQPPEPFTISYIPSGFFSKTPSMISFSTTDILSGVEKYQIKKVRNSWKDVISPLPTPKGIIARDVIVRAVDFNGNIRESSVRIPGLVSQVQLFGIAFFFITCYFLFYVVKRKI